MQMTDRTEMTANGSTQDNKGADAKLIAAAPALLAACKRTVDQLESLRMSVGWNEGGADSPAKTLDPPYIEPALRALRAAIEAAENH